MQKSDVFFVWSCLRISACLGLWIMSVVLELVLAVRYLVDKCCCDLSIKVVFRDGAFSEKLRCCRWRNLWRLVSSEDAGEPTCCVWLLCPSLPCSRGPRLTRSQVHHSFEIEFQDCEFSRFMCVLVWAFNLPFHRALEWFVMKVQHVWDWPR